MPLILALLLLACDPPSRADDMATYADILANAGQDPERELTRCEALGDQNLRGDCAAVVAVAAVKSRGEATRWCARVPEGRWRDECTFQAAEASLRSAGAVSAAGLCQQAGAFQADCVMHLWQPSLTRIVEGMDSGSFAARYDQAEALYQQTASQPGVLADFERRYWLSFFRAGFLADQRVEMRACLPLSVPGRARCEQAAALLLTASLEGALRAAGALSTFCALPKPGAADVASYLGTDPSPALDEAVRAQQPMLCGGGRPALSGGQRTR